jgi:hypothetical protein
MHLCAILVCFTTFYQHNVFAAPGAACSSGIYKAILPLSNYAPAESYCSAHYPVSAVTVTASKGAKIKRARITRTSTTVPHTTTSSRTSTTTRHLTTTTTSSRTSTTTSHPTTTTTSSRTTSSSHTTGTSHSSTTTTSSLYAQQSLWSSLLSAAGNVISTACSCIETPVTITVQLLSLLKVVEKVLTRNSLLLAPRQQLQPHQAPRPQLPLHLP